MPMPAGEGPPRPRLVVRVGVSGHRTLDEADWSEERKREHAKQLETCVEEVLGAIGTAAQAILDEDRAEIRNKPEGDDTEPAGPAYDVQAGVEVRVISGLAEGADRLVTRVASGMRSGPVRYAHAAILPFPAAEFERDFDAAPESVAEFRRLEAGAQAVLAFDDPRARSRRDYGYVALRDALLQHSDVLIAVWDGKSGRGSGGTEDVMTRALRAGIPVVWINSTCRQEPVLVAAPSPDEPDEPPRRRPAKDRPGASLADEIGAALRPTVAPPRYPEVTPPEPTGRQRIDAYYAEPDFAVLPRRAYRVLSRSLSQPGPAGLCGWREAAARFIRAIAAALRERAPGPVTARIAAGEWTETYPLLGPRPECRDRFRDILVQRYVWADQLAVRYADAYRSGFVVIALSGALAVLIGLLTLALPDARWWSLPAKVLFLFLEGYLLYWAGRQYYLRARAGYWHRRFVEYRAVAELLRHQRYIHALGDAERLERKCDEVAGWEPDAWIGWYVRATIRELGFPTLTVTADHARQVLESFRAVELAGTDGQIEYNLNRHESLHRLDRVLVTGVRLIWVAIMILAFGGVALFLLIWGVEIYHLLSDLHEHEWYERNRHWIQGLKVFFTICLAFLPALAAALHGIRAQGEFESFSKRTEATARGLKELAEEIQAALREHWTGRHVAALLLRRANDIMAGDLAGWSAIYRHHAAEPPG